MGSYPYYLISILSPDIFANCFQKHELVLVSSLCVFDYPCKDPVRKVVIGIIRFFTV